MSLDLVGSGMRRLLAYAAWLLLAVFPLSTHAATWQDAYNLTVMDDSRLTAGNVTALRGILDAIPRNLYASLACLHVDSSEPCVPVSQCPINRNGEAIWPCGITILSGQEGWTEDPFPPDLSGTHTRVDGFFAIATHEIGHHVHVTAGAHLRGLQDVIAREIAIAGCEPLHYLRSQITSCFFRDNPQEFVASMTNQWFADSKATLRLGVERFQQGYSQPLNQVALLILIFSANRLYGDDTVSEYATTFTFSYRNGTMVPTLWRVWPWRCGGPVTVSGPGFVVVLEVSPECRVVGVRSTEGL